MVKPQTDGVNQSADAGVLQSNIIDITGTNAGNTSVTRTTLTGALVGALVVDLEDYDTAVVTADFSLVSGAALRLRVSYGDSNDAAELLCRETREDNTVAAVVSHEAIEHTWSATGVYSFVFKRLRQFCKVQFMSDGVPTTDSVSISLVGHAREGH